MIRTLADSLRQAGLAFTIGELDDILWLASRLSGTAPAAPAPAAAPAEETPADEEAGGDGESPAEGVPAGREDPGAAPAGGDGGLPMYSGGTMQGSLSAGVLRVPGVAGTPGPADLRRALQPFIRRVASPRERMLDEEATANGAAESGMWTPMFRPVRERCFELSLVIEECTSATLSARALAELASNLRAYAGLRSVQVYRLGGGATPHLRAENGRELGIERLLHGDHRHLVLFATDGTSSRWRNGTAQGFLHAVGACASVSLLHLLPRPAWEHTLIGEPELTLYAGRAGEANIHLQYTLPRWLDAADARACLPVPVIGMQADSAAAWARVMCARGGASVQGVMVAPPLARSDAPATASGEAPAPVERVARYRQMASPAAFDLAVFLSPIDPLTIPVMRLVQRSMAPDAGDGELAEFILGGLVTQTTPAGSEGETVYRFRDGVSAELTRALRYSEENSIRRQLLRVGRFLDGGTDLASAFAGTFPSPAGNARLTEWAMPFAQVSRDTLRRFAGPALSIEPSGTLSTSLRILHLSDLHLGAARDRASSRDRAELGAPWKAALRAMAAERRVDLVCVSGDVTWSAKPEQFAAASAFLNDTLAALSLPRERLFVVPGNHDLARPHSKGAVPMHSSLPALQKEYRTWVRTFLPHLDVTRDAPFGDFQAALDGWTVPIRILGLDSSWISSGSAAASDFNRDQLARSKPRAGSELLIALVHHSPHAPNAPLHIDAQLAAAGVRLLMHGHDRYKALPVLDLGAGLAYSAGAGLSARGVEPPAVRLLEFDLADPESARLRQAGTYSWNKAARRWERGPEQVVMPPDVLPGPAPDPVPGIEPSEPYFTGRQAELELLVSQIKDRDERPFRVIITGPAGIGKTRLAMMFARNYWHSDIPADASYVRGSAVQLAVDMTGFMAALEVPDAARRDTHTLGEYLRRSAILLIVDDVDKPEQLEALEDLVGQLPGCHVLCIGRDWSNQQLVETVKKLHTMVVQLGALDARDAVTLLARAIPDRDNIQVDLEPIAEALLGIPAALVNAAALLGNQRGASRLLNWIGLGDEALPTGALLKDANRFRPLTAAMQRAILARLTQWQRSSDVDEGMRSVPLFLAHGPLAGCSPALAAALAGMDDQPSAPDRPSFLRLCESAGDLGVRMDHSRIYVTPMWAMCLRTYAPDLGPLAMQRCGQWFASRLALTHAPGYGDWDELNNTQPALLEWLATCPVEAGTLVRDVCAPYLRKRGGQAPWRTFLQRMMSMIPIDDPDGFHWNFVSAQLAAADSDYKFALAELDAAFDKVHPGISDRQRKLATGLGEAIMRQMDPVADLLDNSSAPGGINLEAGTIAIPAVVQLDLLPHHVRLANSAAQAIEAARHHDRRAGIIVQTLGTGMSLTLLAYFQACSANQMLGELPQLIVADRVDLCRQIADRYRAFSPEMPQVSLSEPQTVEELAALLRNAQPGVIVTTVQKLRMLQVLVESECVVVYFGLRSPKLAPLDHFPRATLLVLSYEAILLESSPEQRFGPIIGTYLNADAIGESYLNKVTVRHAAPGEGMDLTGEEVVRYIAADIKQATQEKSIKAVIITERALSSAMQAALKLARTGAGVSVTHVTDLAGQRHEVIEFNRIEDGHALLITSPAVAAGLYLQGVDICYVLTAVPAATMFKLESFVNRAGPSATLAEIIDFAGNDWNALEEARLNAVAQSAWGSFSA